MNSDAGPNIGAQALAGVLTVLAVLLAMRTAYRTIRSTVSLTLWLLKWGVVLWLEHAFQLVDSAFYSSMTRTQRTNDEASLHELASSLGLEDMLDSVLTFQDPETKPKREKKRNPFWK
ncbi:hypothetical protein MVES1_002946 [Malassezia vespertilionis]|uniref:uncharacterized protein n=1 Tax=Malassezia vespertilionis TaxID=2020962 RepID=UPI0024B0530E|nr:uncharacterized protein MVES1_002946 [Malassezia vespertilionis]WFD07579.1 hypothetical protein MVES1_002946 [Malassezia vespertilionis]